GLCSVLQAALLLGASTADTGDMAGRDELPRRISRRADRVGRIRSTTQQALARGYRFCRAPDTARTGCGPNGQLHQWRAVGQTIDSALGNGVSAGRRRTAPSVAALRVRS